MKKYYHIVLLCIIPVVYFITSDAILQKNYPYYLNFGDPEYAYLFNSTNLAGGNLVIGHMDHPGTPVQIIGAFLIKITYLVQGDKSTIYEDVISKPELYLKISANFIILFYTLTLLFVGIFLFYHTKNLFAAAFIQITPLISIAFMAYSPNLMTEPFFSWSGLLLIAIVFLYIYKTNNYKSDVYIIIFSLCSSFSMAVKISTLPLFFLPVILLDNLKDRIKYAAWCIVFFLIFIFPIIPKISFFLEFLSNLVTHKGKYGLGEYSVFNVKEFLVNLGELFTEEYPFTIAFILLIFTVILLKAFPAYFKNTGKKEYKLIFGLLLLFSLQIVMVGKHYSYHYIIPAYNFAILSIYAVFYIFYNNLKRYIRIPFPLIWATLVLIVFVSVSIFRLEKSLKIFAPKPNPLISATNELKHFSDYPKILITKMEYGNHYIEPALRFGMLYSGNLRHLYSNFLKNHYPETYFYNPALNLFSDWKQDFMIEEIMSKYDSMLIYSRNIKFETINSEISTMLDYLLTDSIVYLKQVYSNKEKYEKAYVLYSQKEKAGKQLRKEYEIFSDLESISDDGQFIKSSDPTYKFESANLLCKDISHSGRFSIKLTKRYMYGLRIAIPVKTGMYIKISIFRYASDNKGFIAVQANNVKDFWKASSSERLPGTWQPIEFKFCLPASYPDSTLKVYLWNEGRSDVYFDDIKIEAFVKTKEFHIK